MENQKLIDKQQHECASTIIQQLGGNHFLAMVGAKDIVDIGNGVQLGFRGSKKANKLVVRLNRWDLYDCELWKITPKRCEKVDTGTDLYANMLQYWFKAKTGLDTHL